MSLLDVFKPSTIVNRKPSGSVRNEASNEVYLRPRYELLEGAEAFTVVVDLPGVSKKDLNLTLRDGLLEIVGRKSWKMPEGWKALGRESEDVAYKLRLIVGDHIDEGKIKADLDGGALTLALPKKEEVKPRKIDIN